MLTARVEDGVDILVKNGLIALVGDASEHPVGESTEVIDAKGKSLLPGLIDSHMPERTNVFGLKAVKLFKEAAEELPLKYTIYF